jgi:hypothetical protein
VIQKRATRLLDRTQRGISLGLKNMKKESEHNNTEIREIWNVIPSTSSTQTY